MRCTSTHTLLQADGESVGDCLVGVLTSLVSGQDKRARGKLTNMI